MHFFTFPISLLRDRKSNLPPISSSNLPEYSFADKSIPCFTDMTLSPPSKIELSALSFAILYHYTLKPAKLENCFVDSFQD
ncbi:hypothetical protein CEXT_183891 [Caerostris extrusa]|uniref:Uncharacterized protein n=1 Tax=Caerostris extrusa TaxID=172846 RepID=A0AAV4Y041_CAEEX|nr:hypothetical protein CEXT_183891 [Caerostris extrusa]